MSNTATEGSEPTPVAKAQTKPGTPDRALNKYEQVRLAKKKQRRRAHRKTIGRSNTGG